MSTLAHRTPSQFRGLVLAHLYGISPFATAEGSLIAEFSAYRRAHRIGIALSYLSQAGLITPATPVGKEACWRISAAGMLVVEGVTTDSGVSLEAAPEIPTVDPVHALQVLFYLAKTPVVQIPDLVNALSLSLKEAREILETLTATTFVLRSEVNGTWFYKVSPTLLGTIAEVVRARLGGA